MYQEHSAFGWPGDDAVLWRYMDFTKFASLLVERALFFCRVDRQTGDTWEGALPPMQHRAIQQASERFRCERIQEFESFAEGARARGEEDQERKFLRVRDHFANRKGLSMLDLYRDQRAWTAINCWHQNPHESVAMWGLYVSGAEGIAIRTTASRLAGAFAGHDEPVYIGRVRYIDYQTETIEGGNSFHALMCKRKSFEFESEVRAAISRSKEGALRSSPSDEDPGPWGNVGANIPIELETLVDAVYVSPRSPGWYVDLVQSLLDAYSLKRSVNQSDLDRDPVF